MKEEIVSPAQRSRRYGKTMSQMSRERLRSDEWATSPRVDFPSGFHPMNTRLCIFMQIIMSPIESAPLKWVINSPTARWQVANLPN